MPGKHMKRRKSKKPATSKRVYPNAPGSATSSAGGSNANAPKARKMRSSRPSLSLLQTPELIQQRFYQIELKTHMLVEYIPFPTKPRRRLLCQVLQVNDSEPVACSLRHCSGSGGRVFEHVRQKRTVELFDKGKVVTKKVSFVVKYNRLKPMDEIQVYLSNWSSAKADQAAKGSKVKTPNVAVPKLDFCDDDFADVGHPDTPGAWFNAVVLNVTKDEGYGIVYGLRLSGQGAQPELEKVRYESIRQKPKPDYAKGDILEVFVAAQRHSTSSNNPYVHYSCPRCS